MDPTNYVSTATSNAQFTGSGTMGSAKSFNSLNVIAGGAGESLSLGGNLTLTSPGAILKSGAEDYTISGSGNITAGTELIAHVDGGALTISAPLNTAILGLAKGGTGDLILSGTRAGTMSGAISIAGGQLEFRGNSTLLSGVITGVGGLTINMNAGQTLTINNNSNSYAGPTIVKGGYFSGSGYPTVGLPGGINQTPSTSTSQIMSNLKLEGGVFYATYTFNKDLGAGPGQVQVLAGTSGFVNTANSGGAAGFVLDGGREIVWGSTYFNPTVFVHSLNNGANLALNLANGFDLNGSTRTILVGDATYNATAAGASQLGGVIRTSSGTAGLTKTGIGTLLLSGASTFNGVVTVSQGTLAFSGNANVASANPLGQSSADAANLLLANGATLKYMGGAASSDRSFTINGTADGHSASLDASGTGALVLSNTSTPAYGTSGQTRTLILGGTSTFINTLAAGIADNSGAAVSVTKTGSGLWVLSGANSYTGTNTLSAGELMISSASNLGAASAPLVFNGGTLGITNATLTKLSDLGRTIIANPGVSVGLDIATTTNTFIVDQVITGAVNVVKSGAGTLVFSTNNTYAGQTTISAGVLQYDNGATIPTTPLLNNGALVINRTDTLTQGSTFHSIMGGTGSLTNIGSGTLVLNNVNTYAGITRANAGNITLSHPLAIQNSAVDTEGAAGGIVLSGVATPTFGGLAGAGAVAAALTGYGSVTNLTLNPQSGSTFIYGGVIADNAGMVITKTGAGTQIFTNSNTYTSATYLNAGTLTLSNAAGSLASASIALNGGTLTLANSSGTANSGARISDSASINVIGSSALSFTHSSAAATDYSETIDTLSLQSGTLTYTASQAVSGRTSGLNFNTLSRSGTATANFAGTGLGTNAQNTIKFGAGVTAGDDLGPWAVVNGVDFATYDATLGVKATANTTLATSSSGAATNWKMPAGNITIDASLNPSYKTLLASDATARTNAINGNTVSLGGISSSGANHLISGAGALQALNAGDPLYVNVNNNILAMSSVIQNVGGGGTPSALVKSGSGTLRLTGANTFTGGITLNGGSFGDSTITTPSAALNGNNITVNGQVAMSIPNSDTITGGVLINAAGLLRLGTPSGTANIGGVLSGTGTLDVYAPGGSGSSITLTNTANTFTGGVVFSAGNNGGFILTVNSLVDSATPGAGNIVMGLGGVISSQTFILNSGAIAPLIFNNRQFELAGAGTGQTLKLANNSAWPFVINTDLMVGGTVASKPLTLGGTGAGASTFAGKIVDGPGVVVGLTKVDSGVWTLSGANTYSGTMTINGGTLSINSITNINSGASALGAPITAANGTIAINGGTLQYTGSGHASDRVINMAGATTLDASGTGALVLTSPLTGNQALTLTGSSSATNTLVSALPGTTLTKTGPGTWMLSGANTNTGASAMNGGGTLVLDYATADNSKLPDAAALTLGGANLGGTLTLKDGTHTEIVSATSLGAGGTFLTRSGGSATLLMNTITRAAGGTISLSAASIAAADNTNTNGILGGWATVGNDWAINSTGGTDAPITAYAAYTTPFPAAGPGVNTANYYHNAAGQAQAAVVANTLKIANGQDNDTLTLNGNLTITSASATSLGGLLYVGGLGAYNDNYTISGAGRIVSSVANQELIFTVKTGTLTVGTFVGASGATGPVTKTGPGTLVLSAANNYTGATYVNEGTLRLGNAAACGTVAGGIFVQPGAAVELAGDIAIGAEPINPIAGTGVANGGALRSVSGTNTYGGSITLGTGGALISSASGLLNLTNSIVTAFGRNLTIGGAGNVTISSVVSGAGGLIKEGAGTLTLANTNSYTGSTTINGGTLALAVNNALPGGTAVSIGNATLALGSTTNSVGTLDVTGNATINLGAGAVLSFANSSGVDWTGGTLTLTGTFVPGVSLRFGTTSGGLTFTQLSSIVSTKYKNFTLNTNGYLEAVEASPGTIMMIE